MPRSLPRAGVKGRSGGRDRPRGKEAEAALAASPQRGAGPADELGAAGGAEVNRPGNGGGRSPVAAAPVAAPGAAEVRGGTSFPSVSGRRGLLSPRPPVCADVMATGIAINGDEGRAGSR